MSQPTTAARLGPSGSDPGRLRARLLERREAVLALARRHGASNVRVFGSVARGDHGPESDIDFVADFRDGGTLAELTQLIAALQELLGTDVDVVSARGLRPWHDEILEDAVPL